MDRDLAKVIVMLTLGMGSMIFGLIPAAFTQYNLSRNPLLLTCFLCLGAGILMATSLVHMLPEVIFELMIFLALISKTYGAVFNKKILFIILSTG